MKTIYRERKEVKLGIKCRRLGVDIRRDDKTMKPEYGVEATQNVLSISDCFMPPTFSFVGAKEGATSRRYHYCQVETAIKPAFLRFNEATARPVYRITPQLFSSFSSELCVHRP
jgi:hypothetical protein